MGITKLVQPDQVMDHIPALITRPLIALDAIFFYLGKILWPLDLCIDYGRTPTYVLALGWPHAAALLGGSLLVAALCVVLYRRGMSRNLLVALFFLAAISPVLGFIPFVHQDVSTNADRYLYLGLFALAWSTSLLCRRHRAIGILLVFVTTLLAGLSWQQISYWQDPHAVFMHTLTVNPHSGAAKNMLGRELLMKGENSRAIPYFEEAIRDRPQLEPAYNNLGVALLRLGRKTEAIDNFKKALARSPDYLDPRYNLANALRDTGAFAEAQQSYLEVLQSQPSHDQAHFNLGLMLLNLGRPAEALIHFTAVTHITPLDPDAYEGQADALCGTKDYAEAVEAYQHALNMSPANLRIRRKMSLALIQMNRTSEALMQLDQILQVLPGAADIIELKRQIKSR
jgi:tetratricopeptide (TPR) repeat protein